MFKKNRFLLLLFFINLFSCQLLTAKSSSFPDNYYEQSYPNNCALCSRMEAVDRKVSKCPQCFKAIDPVRLTSNPIPFTDKTFELVGYITEIKNTDKVLFLNFVPGGNFSNLIYLQSNFTFATDPQYFEDFFSAMQHCKEMAGCVRLFGKLRRGDPFYIFVVKGYEKLWFNLHQAGEWIPEATLSY